MISNPKLQIGLCKLRQSNLRFRNFGFEMQDSSDFKISSLVAESSMLTPYYLQTQPSTAALDSLHGATVRGA